MTRQVYRDINDLRRRDLISDYLHIAHERPGALVATALRTRSLSMRDILASGAFGSEYDSAELLRIFLGDCNFPEIRDVGLVANLGQLIILQNILPDDRRCGAALLALASDHRPSYRLSSEHARLLIQYHVINKDHDRAIELLNDYEEIDREDHEYLRTELLNPFNGNEKGLESAWLQRFNGFFAFDGLTGIGISPDKVLPPFDRITTVANKRVPVDTCEPLVSVVITAFRPDSVRLKTSVESLLKQTWKNLQIIIVNDASGPAYDSIFDSVTGLDDRILLINLPKNSGTYVARNVGYKAAIGDFITGQDDDDWSHPERIQQQIEYLGTHPEAIGCRVRAIACNDSLEMVRLGSAPVSENASSLMIRREAYDLTGGFVEARKAADTEFYYRVQRITDRPIGTLDKYLTIIRLLSDSLSRSEFSPGWRHSARRTFRSAYEYWHRHSNVDQLRLDNHARPPIKVPRRFLVKQSGSRKDTLDVVFAGDWQQYGGPQKSMLEEIAALSRSGLRVGVMNLEAARFMSKAGRRPLIDEIQGLINSGEIDEVLYDDAVRVRLLILRYPPILQFFAHESSQLIVDSMIILANQAPAELDGSDIRYIVNDCHKNAQEAFGLDPMWVPQGPQVRDILEKYLSAPTLADFDMPGILDIEDWWLDRLWYRSTIPVVGRHSRDSPMKWPQNSTIFKQVYPIDGALDVRIMGSRKTPLQILGAKVAPPSWTIYNKDELPVREFLWSLDYFVYFQHKDTVEAFGRSILEALASGCLVILPPHFERVFGEAAIYSRPEEVPETIMNFHTDFNKYKQQTTLAQGVLSRAFSYEAYREKINLLLVEAHKKD